jgi:hypothetical protein
VKQAFRFSRKAKTFKTLLNGPDLARRNMRLNQNFIYPQKRMLWKMQKIHAVEPRTHAKAILRRRTAAQDSLSKTPKAQLICISLTRRRSAMGLMQSLNVLMIGAAFLFVASMLFI